ncbi:MAG: hypothetical protein U5K84_11595 [Alkalibacterium sp.]|nr:hypothetical protein [Alkalibacterium sp.]
MKKKSTALEEENSRLIDEHDRLTEGYASTLTLSDIQESGQENDANVTTSSERRRRQRRTSIR